jgi:hypothetical protein
MQTLASLQMLYDTKNYILRMACKTFIFLKTNVLVCYMVGPCGFYDYMTKKNKNPLEPTLSDDGMSLTIPYKKNNQMYSITVPYKPMCVSPMVDFETILKKGDKSIPITQQPGIPYLSTPSDLNADSITIINKATGRSHVYNAEETPHFGYMLHDNE